MNESGRTFDSSVFLSEEDRCSDSAINDSTNQFKSRDKMKITSESLKVLDPEDPLMKRFQDSLKAHLARIDDRLSNDILNIENDWKESKKRRESKAAKLYTSQNELARQQEILERHQKRLFELAKFRDEKDSQIDDTRELRRSIINELENERSINAKFSQDIERLASLNRHFSEWKEEITSHARIARRMSEREAIAQRELLRQKQQEDYIMANLMEEISRLENEIKHCCEQLSTKTKERSEAGETITDANTDLEGLQRTQKKLFYEWNHVVASIAQRDKVSEELDRERGNIRESFATLASQIEKLKKDTSREMEKNERLTTIQTRLENDVRYNVTIVADEKSKIDNIESQLIDTSKKLEQVQNESDTSCWDYQRCIDEEKIIDKELEKLSITRNELEDTILSRLENKVSRDKNIKSLNKNLREAREKMRENELTMIQTENHYGRNSLELERLKAFITTEKYHLEDFLRINGESEKELDVNQNEIKKCDTIIVKKQQKIVSLNKKIQEIISSSTSGEEASPLDLRIKELEKSIEETELNNRRSQEIWLRQEGYMVTMSEERTGQLREMNLLDKQITIMEQKSLKLERDIETRRREDENICRSVKILRQKLIFANEHLAIKRETRDVLEDKNCITRSECVETLREAEIELLKLQNNTRQLGAERKILEEQLKCCQREIMSWEKKVRLASETAKKLKDESCAGGEIALMKSEIHKMEIRLSHLRKAQEKMIRDMEFCVARRDVIMDGAAAREKKNPRSLHNQRVVFEKRMNDQRLRIKQINKETKEMENKILELEIQQKSLLEQLDENQIILRGYEDNIPDIDKQINEGELVKYHKLDCLVRKQRKVRMLQDVKDGRYRMTFKSEISLNDELEKQRAIGLNLKDVMEEARRDFPLLKDDIRKIIMGMENS